MPFIAKTILSLQAAEARFNPGRDKGGLKQFYAVVTHAGQPSDRPVTGTEAASSSGQPLRVLIPREAMRRRVDGLRGKPLFATAHLQGHGGRQEIGYVAESWLDNTSEGEPAPVQALGYLDPSLPLAGKTVERSRSEGGLAVSLDINALKYQLSQQGGEEILVVQDFEWEGATALQTEKAAYSRTRLAASTADQGGEANNMSEKNTTAAPAAADIEAKLPEMISAAVEKALKPVNDRLENLEKPPEAAATQLPPAQADLKPVLEAIQGMAGDIKALKDASGNAPITTTGVVTPAARPEAQPGDGGLPDEVKGIDSAIQAVQRGQLGQVQKMAAIDDLRRQRREALMNGRHQ